MDFGPDSTNPVAFSQDDPDTIYLLTSLTAGSSSIITATSRLEHLLKSNKVPFKAVDLATDDRARGLWGRRGAGKRLPGVVKDGMVLGNYEDLEEWNEYGELKQNLGIKPTKKKKKKKSAETDPSISKRSTDLSGSTSSVAPMATATPNAVSEELPSDAVSGVQAVLAAAAAAAGRNLKNTGSIRSFASGDRPVTAIADGTYEKEAEKMVEETKEEEEEEVVVAAEPAAPVEAVEEKVEAPEADEEKADEEKAEVTEVETEEVVVLTAPTVVVEEVAPAPVAPEIAEEKQPEATETEKLAAAVDAAFAFDETTTIEELVVVDKAEEPTIEEPKAEEPKAEVEVEVEVEVEAAVEKKDEEVVIGDNSWADATLATLAATTSIVLEQKIENVEETEENVEEKTEVVEEKTEVEEKQTEVKVEEEEGDMATIEEEQEDEEEVEVKVEKKVEAEKVEEKKEDEKVEEEVKVIAKVEEKEADKAEEKKEDEKDEEKVEEKPVEKADEKAEEKVEKPKEKDELPIPQVQIQASEEKKDAETKVKFSQKPGEKATEKKNKEATAEDGSEGKLKPEAAAGTPEDGDSGNKINKTRLFSWFRVRLSFKKSTGDLKKAPTATSAADRANLRKSRSTDELRKSTYALFRSKSIEKGLNFEKVEKAADPAPATTPAPTATPAITTTPAPTATPQ